MGYRKYRSKEVAALFVPVGNVQTPDTTEVTVTEENASGEISYAYGATVPTDAEAGYAVGCLFVDTDSGVGTTWYINEGDETSCDFNAVTAGAGGVTTFVALTDTPANFTGAGDKLVKVNTGATALEFVTVSGDVAMSLTGVMTVTDLTMAGEAQGDVLYFDGTNWVVLAAGTNGYLLKTQGAAANPAWVDPATLPVGVASSLSQTYQIEAGAFDIVHAVTDQTVGSPELTIPDFANVDDTYAFVTLAQTLLNKTLTSPSVNTQLTMLQTTHNAIIVATDQANQDNTYTIPDVDGNDSFCMLTAAQALTNKTLTSPIIVTTDSIVDAGGDAYLTFVESATPRDSIQITQGDVTVGAKIESVTADTNADLLLDAAGSGDVVILNGTELTFRRATFDALVVVADQTGEDHTFNLPDIATGASDTFAFLAEAQTLTNKTIDVDSNTVSNINGDELDPITPGASTYGVPIVLTYQVTNQGAAVNIFNTNAPFKFRVIDAYSVNESGDGGTWKLNNGVAGGGTDLHSAVTVAASDTDIDRIVDLDNAAYEIASGGSLSLIPDVGGALDCTVYITIMRID